eukprot:UN11527
MAERDFTFENKAADHCWARVSSVKSKIKEVSYENVQKWTAEVECKGNKVGGSYEVTDKKQFKKALSPFIREGFMKIHGGGSFTFGVEGLAYVSVMGVDGTLCANNVPIRAFSVSFDGDFLENAKKVKAYCIGISENGARYTALYKTERAAERAWKTIDSSTTCIMMYTEDGGKSWGQHKKYHPMFATTY